MKKLRTQRIRIKPELGKLDIGGWLSPNGSYIWIGDSDGRFLGTLGGHRLYRLAKAIVRHHEHEKARRAGAVTKR